MEEKRINQASMERALKYLAETDKAEADLYKLSLEMKERKESVFSLRKAAHDGTVAEREAFAYDDEQYKQAADAYFDAIAAHREIKNKRDRAIITIDVWRSLNSRLNKGNIL